MSLIRRYRTALGWSQKQLAEKLGIGTASVSTLELNEDRGVAKTATVDRALSAMGKTRITFVIDTLPEQEMLAIREQAAQEVRKIAWTMALEAQPLTEDAKARLEDKVYARRLLDA
ncbi:helix-turn-helix domain-containing protein [Arthrobacter sp. VKM Ac-2550]|uniref:helix-turn-helix domain-containing protein n=1 Tax=Crystallibacter permensis TaxID=1938888 RepID=UPI002227AFDF|nr:helix-turn-helix domain-containing protein [Arthrobacter sp. VKM Ac-2550]MCW2134369.1 helix-turn-helix protein [Arthrobacter sp. VKM Ac-2550]